jgi:hypothetical protein
MSSFIVSEETIQNIIGIFYFKGTEYSLLSYQLDKILGKEDNCQALDRLGRKLIKLNIQAVNSRYPKHQITQEEEKSIKAFSVNAQHVPRIQRFKSLQCFLYQCSEGNIPSRKLFKQLAELKHSLADIIVSRTPEYEKAEWN